MTTNDTEAPPPPHDPSGEPPRREPTDLGSLRRSLVDRHVAGVAGGLARHFGIDPIIIRVALVVLVFFGGAGVLLYVGAWLLVPEEGTEHAVVRLDDRSRSFLLYVVGAVAALALLGDTIGHFHLPWGLLVVAIVVAVILGNRDRVRMRSRERDDSWTRGVYDTPLGTAGSFAPDPTDAPAAPGAPAGADPASAYAQRYAEKYAPERYAEKYNAKIQRYETRRRGPILFWFTLALIIVALGALGLADLAGANVAGPAYPALAVGVIGLMLVIGAFWGRAGGLILLGLIGSVFLAGGIAADQWGLDGHSRDITYAPTTSAAVQDSYHLGTGDLVVDLSKVTDPTALAGREIEVTAHVARIDVILPAGLNVDAHGTVHGPGELEIFGEGHGGINTSFSGSVRQAADADTAPLTIDAELNVGRITVETR